MNYTKEFIKANLYSGVISDVLDQMGYRNQTLGGDIMPLQEDTILFGPAFTSIGTEVYSMPEQPLVAQCRVVNQLQEGDVYILVTRGQYNCAVFGELFATAVFAKKGEGVLLDGYVRDIRALKSMDFPVFYRGRSPKTSKGRCEINECQIPVQLEGVVIHPGDLIFADIDGIAVIPRAIADEVIARSIETVMKENTVRIGLQEGATLEEVYTKIGAI